MINGQLNPAGAHESLWNATGAPYTIARTYSTAAGNRLLLLSGTTGWFRVLNLTDGGAAASLQAARLETTGWRAAEIVEQSGSKWLYLFNHDGLVHRHVINADGTLETTPYSRWVLQGLRDKSIFDTFTVGGDPHAFGLDPATGEVHIHRLPLFPSVTNTFTLGWSDIDHVTVGGKTYRLLYKQVGHPFRPSNQNGAQAGRFVIQEVGADGLGLVNHVNVTEDVGLTVVRFFPYDNANVGILFYRNTASLLETTKLLGVTGTYHVDRKTSSSPPKFDDVQFYRAAGTTYFVGIELDVNVPVSRRLSGDPAARLAQCVHDNLAGRVAGYQLAMAQTGEILIDRAWGVRQISPTVLPMTRINRINMGSVGKMFTTVTTLKLADLGELSLNNSIDFALGTQHSQWTSERTPLDLMAQTTGNDRSSPSCREHPDLTVDCEDFFRNTPPKYGECTKPAVGLFTCNRYYSNPHFGALRQIIEAVTRAETTREIVDVTRSLWLDAIVYGPSCMSEPNSMLFGWCSAKDTCFGHGGGSWVQNEEDRIDGWSKSCGAGGWNASAQDMVRIMEALRGEQVLTSWTTAQLFDTTLKDLGGNPTALGWDEPVRPLNPGPSILGKGGYAEFEETGAGAQAHIYNFEGGAHAALLINTAVGAPDPGDLLKRAYRYAVLPFTYDCDILMTAAELDEFDAGFEARSLDVVYPKDEVFVTANRGPSDGDLQLQAWRRLPTGEIDIEPRYDALHASGAVRMAAIGSDRLVVATRNEEDELEIILFELDALNQILLKDRMTHGGAFDWEIVPLGLASAEFATVVRRDDNKLEVTAWDIQGSQYDQLVREGSWVSPDEVYEIAAARRASPGRLFVATQTGDGKLRPITFQISNNGSNVTKTGNAVSADQPSAGDIRVAMVDVNGTELFVTAHENFDDKLMTAVWSVNASGNTVTRLSLEDWSDVYELGGRMVSAFGPHVVIPVRVDDGDSVRNGEVWIFEVEQNGSLVFKKGIARDDAEEIAVAARTESGGRHYLAGSYRRQDILKVPLWEVLGP